LIKRARGDIHEATLNGAAVSVVQIDMAVIQASQDPSAVHHLSKKTAEYHHLVYEGLINVHSIIYMDGDRSVPNFFVLDDLSGAQLLSEFSSPDISLVLSLAVQTALNIAFMHHRAHFGLSLLENALIDRKGQARLMVQDQLLQSVGNSSRPSTLSEQTLDLKDFGFLFATLLSGLNVEDRGDVDNFLAAIKPSLASHDLLDMHHLVELCLKHDASHEMGIDDIAHTLRFKSDCRSPSISTHWSQDPPDASEAIGIVERFCVDVWCHCF
jgi:hypothetical protein